MKPTAIIGTGIALVPFMIAAALRTVGGYDAVQCLLLWIGLTSAAGFSFCLIAINDFISSFSTISRDQEEELRKIRECVTSVSHRIMDISN